MNRRVGDFKEVERVPHPLWFSKGALFVFFFSSFKEIDPDQSFFAFFIEVPTGGWATLRR